MVGHQLKAVFVLGTPVREDANGRMMRAIGLLAQGAERVIVVLGNTDEAAYMKRVALEYELSSDRMIINHDSKTTIDNAYYAKKICQQLNLVPDVLVASQYQLTRAAMTFAWVFGPEFTLSLSPSSSMTNTKRRLRETVLRGFIPLFFIFRKGDDEALKRASDTIWKLIFR